MGEIAAVFAVLGFVGLCAFVSIQVKARGYPAIFGWFLPVGLLILIFTRPDDDSN